MMMKRKTAKAETTATMWRRYVNNCVQDVLQSFSLCMNAQGFINSKKAAITALGALAENTLAAYYP